MHEKIYFGILYGALAALFSTLMSFCVKMIGDRASLETIVFFRFLIGTLLMTPLAIKKKFKLRQIRRPGLLLSRTLCSLAAMGCLFYAITQISLANALVLNSTAPLFTALFVYIASRAKTPWGSLLGIVLGLSGVVLVLQPSASQVQLADLFGLASGLFAAITFVQIRKLTKQNSAELMTYYNFCLTALLTLFLLPFGWITPTAQAWLWIGAMGVLGTLYQYMLTLAFTHAPVRISSSLLFLNVVFGIIIDALVWHELPSGEEALGVVLILAGGLMTVLVGTRYVRKQQ